MLYVMPRTLYQSSHLWYDNPELDNVRRQVQSFTDNHGVSSRQYTDAITNIEALHASAAAKAASEIIDEIGLHTEKCKPAAAWRAINRLTGRKFKLFNCLSAASIADRKRQLTNHYSAIHNEQQQHYCLPYSQQWQHKILFRSPLHLLPPKFALHYGRRVMTHLPASTIFRIAF